MKYFIIIVIFFSGVLSAQQAKKITPEEFKKADLIFKQKCTRCHVNEGKSFGKDFAKMNKEKLKHIVEDMMYGPARLKPTEKEIDEMMEYLISLNGGMK